MVQKVSKEFVNFVILEEAAKLLSRRCLDLGFVPFVSPGVDPTVKMFGPGITSASREAKMTQLGVETKLADLGLSEQAAKSFFLPVLLKNSLQEIRLMEEGLNEEESTAELATTDLLN